MKPFHKNLIVLSLSALVLAGSGCERRGRAPTQKKTDPTGVVNTENKGDDLNAVEKKKEETETKTEGKLEQTQEPLVVSTEEAQLITDSAMTCKASINATEAATAETFAKDFAQMRDLFMCMSTGAGVAFREDKDSKIWEIDSAILKKEYIKLAREKDSNDERAEFILKSRLSLLRLNATKMAAKYAQGKIDQDLEISTGTEQKKKVSLAVEDLHQMSEAATLAETEVAGFETVRDGQDFLSSSDDSESADADEASEE